jgi:hypothetical protein
VVEDLADFYLLSDEDLGPKAALPSGLPPSSRKQCETPALV